MVLAAQVLLPIMLLAVAVALDLFMVMAVRVVALPQLLAGALAAAAVLVVLEVVSLVAGQAKPPLVAEVYLLAAIH